MWAGTAPVPLSQTSAHDYNPFGTGPENRGQVDNIVDSDPNTTWSTAHYYERTLKKTGGTGLGVYLDAAPGVIARQIELQTPTPGFGVQIYAANHFESTRPYGDATTLVARGWQGPFGADASVHSHERIPLKTSGHRFRYYLVWLTTLPPGGELASIAEVTLFR